MKKVTRNKFLRLNCVFEHCQLIGNPSDINLFDRLIDTKYYILNAMP